ncbi:MAG: hypothetical protein LBD58_06095 [Treponema sp.]|jgi:hypothetical protein|nr:hypothetical protein [Treponema sp.]
MMSKANGIGLFLICVLFLACGGAPAPAASTVPADELDAAIRETSDYLNKQLPKGNKLVILNIQSDFPALSEYIIDELIANTVNDKIFSVVDRQQLNTIRAELDFQMSGEVDDNTAQALGRMAGAQTIISGAVSKIGDLYRLRVRGLSVQTAAIEGQFNRNIPDGPVIAALVKSEATGYGGGAAAKPAGQASDPALDIMAQALGIPAQNARDPADPAPVPTPVKEEPKVYKAGDTGPAGGLIFYDKGNNSGGWRYLEAAPADIVRKLYATEEGVAIEAQRAVGTGKANTQAIMVQANNRGGGFGWAAQACDALEVNGFDDWFLPSRDELHYMYGNLHMRNLGGFSLGWYWSSTYSGYESYLKRYYWWGENFSDGGQEALIGNRDSGSSSKTQCRVRAIRQF